MIIRKNIPDGSQALLEKYGDFWLWFQKNARRFFEVVKSRDDVEKNCFDELAEKLGEIKEGYFFLAGMASEQTAELVLTADGDVKNIAFVEDLVKAAPEIGGWKFTPLKPALQAEDIHIEMEGFRFDKDNLSFYSNDSGEFPDEISISVAHEDYTEKNKQQIVTGTLIFLDNYLGELDFVENIDRIKIISDKDAIKERIPISRLKEFLKWRRKEFVERYDDIFYDAEKDGHTLFEAESETGGKLIAIINPNLLKWHGKASHPWIAVMSNKFDGADNKGLPSDKDYDLLDKIEEQVCSQLPDKDGYLYLGRQLGDNEQNLYFACKDYRRVSRVFYNVQQYFSKATATGFDIYKDKYWRSLSHFISN